MQFMYRPGTIARWLYYNAVWRIPTKEKKLYLTFDDGPTSEVTDWVLDLLQQYKIKATFFCVGENILKHKNEYNRLVNEGHAIGNHTFNHLNGWKTKTSEYISNTNKFHSLNNTRLFRPPYGKIKQMQVKALSANYKIIMWDVLSLDYNSAIDPKKSLKNTVKYSREGSIVVFHDNEKSYGSLQKILQEYIETMLQKGYSFHLLS